MTQEELGEDREVVEKEYLELAQKMITEFFEDNLGRKFDKKKRIKMHHVFEETNIYYSDMLEDNIGGRTYPPELKIELKKIDNKILFICNLIHEYGHMFSWQDGIGRGYGGTLLEEGNLDRLAELAINHYIKKYGELKIGNRMLTKSNIPYIYITGYQEADSVTKTLLYPLSREKKDILALSEYLLGEKSKYIGMVLDKKRGKEYKKIEKILRYGKEPKKFFSFNYTDVFLAHPDAFESIDKKSIYWENNTMLPAMVLQNRIGYDESIYRNENILDGYSHSCSRIEKFYFGNRKLYDISYQELKEFCELIRKQSSRYVQGFDEFVIGKFTELTDEEIGTYYSKILHSSRALLEGNQYLNSIVGNVLSKSINFEIQDKKRCSEVEAVNKYKVLVDYFVILSNISTKEASSMDELIKNIDSLRLMYARKIGNGISKNSAEVLDAVNINLDETLIVFDSVLKDGLKASGVELKYDKSTNKICWQSILDIACEQNVTLSELEKMGIDIEKEVAEKGRVYEH